MLIVRRFQHIKTTMKWLDLINRQCSRDNETNSAGRIVSMAAIDRNWDKRDLTHLRYPRTSPGTSISVNRQQYKQSANRKSSDCTIINPVAGCLQPMSPTLRALRNTRTQEAMLLLLACFADPYSWILMPSTLRALHSALERMRGDDGRCVGENLKKFRLRGLWLFSGDFALQEEVCAPLSQ
jgi:hypothetical protein